jgi:hypothetical protein
MGSRSDEKIVSSFESTDFMEKEPIDPPGDSKFHGPVAIAAMVVPISTKRMQAQS